LVFVFLYVFPKIGQGIGGGGGASGESSFATVLVAGVRSHSPSCSRESRRWLYRWPMSSVTQKEIEDRVLAPCPYRWWPSARLLPVIQGIISALIVFPIAR